MKNALKIIGIWLVAICVCLLVGWLVVCAWNGYLAHAAGSHPRLWLMAYGLLCTVYGMMAYLAIVVAVAVTVTTIDPHGKHGDLVECVATGLYYLFAFVLIFFED